MFLCVCVSVFCLLAHLGVQLCPQCNTRKLQKTIYPQCNTIVHAMEFNMCIHLRKVCPQCNTVVHVKRSVCDCGHAFASKKRKAQCTVASFPGSHMWEEERGPGTHCSHMRQVPLVTCILLHYTKITVNSVYLQKGSTAWLYSF